MKRLVLILSAALLFAQGQASAQFPGMPRVNRDSLNALTNADHAQMLGQLGLTSVRPGRDAYTDDPNRAPNYDEMKANPWIYYPDPLVTFDGRQVKNAKMWRNVRRPELVKAFEDEVYGRVPENVPAIQWEVVKEEKVDMEGIPCIRRDLAGVADNSACPSIEVRIQAQVTWPEAAKGPVPVIMEFGFIMPAGMSFNFPGGNNRPRAKSWQQQVVERGWAAAVIVTGSIQADGGHGLRSGIVGLTNKGDYRKPTDWGALRAWAWGASKLVDYFETTREFDATKVAIEGVSRNGKAALVTMAFDERFAAALVASAGEGGSSPWRRNCGESLGMAPQLRRKPGQSGRCRRIPLDVRQLHQVRSGSAHGERLACRPARTHRPLRPAPLLHFKRYLGCGQVAGPHRHVHGYRQGYAGL